MQNKLKEMAAFLADSENASAGFATMFLYRTGTEKFNLKWREVRECFLKPHFAMKRGFYSGNVDAADLEKFEGQPSVKAVKAPKAPKAPKAVKAPKVAKLPKAAAVKPAKVKKDKLPAHVVEAPMDPVAKTDRLELIAKIAKRNAETDRVIAELTA